MYGLNQEFAYFYKWTWIKGHSKTTCRADRVCVIEQWMGHDVVSEYRKRYGFLNLRKDEEKFRKDIWILNNIGASALKWIHILFDQRAITLLTLSEK